MKITEKNRCKIVLIELNVQAKYVLKAFLHSWCHLMHERNIMKLNAKSKLNASYFRRIHLLPTISNEWHNNV